MKAAPASRQDSRPAARGRPSVPAPGEPYRSLFEHDLTGDFLAAPDGKIRLCNRAFARIFGFSSSRAALGSRLGTLQVVPNGWPAFLRLIKERGRLTRFECTGRHRGGQRLHLLETVVGKFNARGRLVELQGYVFDDTHRKQAEAARQQLNATLEQRVARRTAELTEANQRLQAIMDGALVGILTLDQHGKIISVNPAAARIFGCPPAEILQRPIRHFVVAPGQRTNATFPAWVRQAKQPLLLSRPQEIPGRRGDGKDIILELTLTQFRHHRERQFIAMVRDITERKRLEREFLEISEREQQRIGHDLHDGLGQQLHGLSYLAVLLEKGLQEEGSSRSAEAGQLNKYLNEALEMTRSLAHGLQPVTPMPEGLMIALRELAGRTRALYRVDCRLVCRTEVLIHRHSVANHLYRIAQEAVSNAMKHGKPTRVRIRLAALRQRVILGISDNGVGIQQPPRPGRGMGLHVMQYRAGAINGSLVVQRHARGGTEVVCTVARHVPASAAEEFK